VARQVRQIIWILAATLAGAGILQLFVPMGTAVFVAACTVGGIAFLLWALLVRGRVRDTLGGFRFTAVVLFVLGIASAVGTVILQGKPADIYERAYGRGLASFILALRLDDIFHSLPFAGLLALFAAAVTVSAIRRWPITRYNTGFFLVHGGLLVSLLGAGLSALFAVKGRVDLRVGRETADKTSVTRNGVSTGQTVPLGFTLRLDKFDVDKYHSEFRMGVYLPAKTGDYALKASFDPDADVRHRLPDGDWYRVKEYYPDMVTTERVAEVAADGMPALQVRIGEQSQWIFAGGRVDAPDGKVVAFDYQKPAPPGGAMRHLLKVGDKEPQPVAMGDSVAMPGGGRVKALRYFPHFSMDLENHQYLNVDDKPVNPALEVEVAGGADADGKRWLFAKMPDFDHGRGLKMPLVYSQDNNGGPAPTAVLVCAKDSTVTVTTADGERTIPFKAGMEIPEAGVKLVSLLAQARTERVPSTVSDKPNNPGLLVEVSDRGRTYEKLLEARNPEPVRFANGTALVFEKREDEVKAYRSLVTASAGGESVQTEVAVNSPLSFRGWTVYQVNYDPKDPSYSGLEVVKDPGVTWVFVGFGLLSAGVIWVYNVKPRIRKKPHPRPAAAEARA